MSKCIEVDFTKPPHHVLRKLQDLHSCTMRGTCDLDSCAQWGKTEYMDTDRRSLILCAKHELEAKMTGAISEGFTIPMGDENIRIAP